MKLAFTTLGCPNWDLDTIISKAVKYGYDGVDFRGYLGEMDIYKLPLFLINYAEIFLQLKLHLLSVPPPSLLSLLTGPFNHSFLL